MWRAPRLATWTTCTASPQTGQEHMHVGLADQPLVPLNEPSQSWLNA
ncbi:hypothetical protein TIFTF001_028665 [Ficus carica]|uniref:Uncharacterized protein n=1 Tax=Ficus carica TaxID=3494 RepID=A0AA88IWV3_FICCA|nr:hypothetical protein TIFTF001_028665 [Ficus carica]